MAHGLTSPTFGRFKDSQYVCWVTSGLGIQYTKVGLENYIESTSNTFYGKMKKDICGSNNTCLQCDFRVTGRIAKSPFECRFDLCRNLKGELDKQTTYYIDWKNTPNKRISTAEDLTALYVPDFLMSSYKAPAETDISAFLYLMDKCKPFQIVDKKRLQKMIETHNAVMNPCTMRMNPQELQHHLDNCIILLEAVCQLNNDTQCKDAIARITKIRNSKLPIHRLEEAETGVLNTMAQLDNLKTEYLRKQLLSKECTLENRQILLKESKKHEEKFIKLKVLFEVHGLITDVIDAGKKKCSKLCEEAEHIMMQSMLRDKERKAPALLKNRMQLVLDKHEESSTIYQRETRVSQMESKQNKQEDEYELAPTFTKELENQSVKESMIVILECHISKPTKTSRWMKDDKQIILDDRITFTRGKYTHRLEITDVTLEDAGNYRCECDNVSTECALTVEELATEFTQRLENQTVYETTTVILECRLSKPDMTTQWMKNGRPICPDDNTTITVGIYTHKLIITNVTLGDAGNFRCCCANVSTECNVTVKETTTRDDWFNGERYCNWVKIILALIFLRRGISKFSNDKAAYFHEYIKTKVRRLLPDTPENTCQRCTYKSVIKDKNAAKWRMNCEICCVWLERILKYHKPSQLNSNIAWVNSNPTLWPTACWEVIKIFQPVGCGNHQRAEDCDATGLLTMIHDCSFVRRYIKNLTVIDDIKAVRNACMHSNDLQIKESEMKKGLGFMIEFLEEELIKEYDAAIDAAAKIKEIQMKRLDMSLHKELETIAFSEKLKEVEKKITRLILINKNLRYRMDGQLAKHESDIAKYHVRLKEFEDMFLEIKRSLQKLVQHKDPDIRNKFTALTKRLHELEQANREVDSYYQQKIPNLKTELQFVKSQEQEHTEKKPEEISSYEETTELSPWFSKKLKNQNVNEKEMVTLECQLSKPNKAVIWLKGISKVCPTDRITVEADIDTHRIKITDVTLGDAGEYMCSVDNDSTSCTLNVKELATEFTTKLENQTAIETVTVTLECQLSKPYKKVKWIRNGHQIVNDNRIAFISDKHKHQLVIKDVTLGDAGNYRCESAKGSTDCTLKVKEFLSEFTKKLENKTVKGSQTVTLECQLSKPNKTVTWMKNGRQVVKDDHITIVSDIHKHQLIIADVTTEDAGNFRCECDIGSTECTLKVEVAFVHELDDTHAYLNDGVILSCALNRPNTDVTWTHDRKVVLDNDNLRIVSSIYTHQLIFSNLTRKEAGTYTCAYGDVATNAKLTVDAPDRRSARKLNLDGTTGLSVEDMRSAVLAAKHTLKSLSLRHVDLSSLGDNLSDVVTLDCLEQFELFDTKLSPAQCQILAENLRCSSQLTELRLRDVSCTSQEQIDLKGPVRLRYVQLDSMQSMQVMLNAEMLLRYYIDSENNIPGQVSALQSLRLANNLQQFTLRNASDTVVNKLVDVLPMLKKLQLLQLWNIDFSSVKNIQLSTAMDHLDIVYLGKCKFDYAGLDRLLHPQNLPPRRVNVVLQYITIRGKNDLISKIRSSPDIEVTDDMASKYKQGEWRVEFFIYNTRK